MASYEKICEIMDILKEGNPITEEIRKELIRLLDRLKDLEADWNRRRWEM